MEKLQTSYLGLTLHSPLVVSASPLSRKVETAQALAKAGAGAIVMYSLFEEQLIHESLELDHYLTYGTESHAEATNYLPTVDSYNLGGEKYLEQIRRLKDAVEIPVIASLNGVTPGGWLEWGEKMAESGADAIELNIYYLPDDLEQTSAVIEENYLRLIQELANRLNIPLAVKLTPFITGIGHFAKEAAAAGAKGLVLFNRFYQPDINIETLEIEPRLELSTSSELLLPLRWIALLHGRVPVDFAITSGVHTAEDVLKSMMAGAKVAMMASELIKAGPGRIQQLHEEILSWMEKNEYESIAQMQGSMSDRALGQNKGLRRANYIDTLNSFTELP